MSPKAQSPISWHDFQTIMRDFGYEMVSHEADHEGVIFRLRQDAITEGLRNPVTIRYPDYVARDGQTPAFERHYVIDLMTWIGGANGGKAVVTFLARRRLDG